MSKLCAIDIQEHQYCYIFNVSYKNLQSRDSETTESLIIVISANNVGVLQWALPSPRRPFQQMQEFSFPRAWSSSSSLHRFTEPVSCGSRWTCLYFLRAHSRLLWYRGSGGWEGMEPPPPPKNFGIFKIILYQKFFSTRKIRLNNIYLIFLKKSSTIFHHNELQMSPTLCTWFATAVTHKKAEASK